MKYVEIKAIEINSIDSDVLQDSVIFGVDETVTKPEDVPAVLRKILKKHYNIASFGQEVSQRSNPVRQGNGRNRREIPE